MKDIKQFKLTNDDEIICEVIQYDGPDNSAMVVRGAMKIILIEDHKRGIRFYAFRPWMGFTDDPTILQTLNAAHIIGEVFPSEEIVEHYSGTVKKIKKALIKKDMALDEIHESAADQFLMKEAKWFQVNYSYAAGMLDKVFNNYKTHLTKSKGLVLNTKKNFSLKAMHDKFKVIMDEYVKLPEFVSLKLPEIKKL